MTMLVGGFMNQGDGPAAGNVTVSGENVNSVWTDKVGIEFRPDGKVYKLVGSTYTQIDVTTDWIDPPGDAGPLYEVMTDNWVDIGGALDGFLDEAAAEGVWIAITSARLWSVKGVGSGGADSNGMQFDAQIRFNGGAELDSGPFEILSELE